MILPHKKIIQGIKKIPQEVDGWGRKVGRTISSPLPVSQKRKGNCIDCGACCKLPSLCPFLKFKDNKSYCSIYDVRPLNCRKYPRTKSEFVTQDTCGFKFE